MSENQDDPTRVHFHGYTSPNYTQVPDELFDVQLPELSGAELKVLLYIMRRTFGFKKEADDISLNQICHGIKTRDGRVLDRGTGLSKSTAQLAIKGLLAKNIILTKKRVSKEKGNEATTFRLNVGQPYAENRHRVPVPEFGIGLYRKSALQETVKQQTDLDFSNFERSNGQFEQTSVRSADSTEAMASVHQALDQNSSATMPLGELLQHRAAVTGSPNARSRTSRRGRSPGTPEEREVLAAYLGDFARELGDEAPLSSTITRVLTLLQTAHLPPDQWGDLLYQARSITQEHTAQIRTLSTSTDGEQSIRRKNKMPYFLAVLEDLLGLAEDRPTAPSS